MYIADQPSFEAFIERAGKSPVLAIDTEFLREKTYYPKLCLLQLATEEEVAVVDPFAVESLAPLVGLLENEKVVKLFHAAAQDLEILWREVGAMPRPLFDTQVAAALLGHVQQIGYASLVGAVCGVSLKKIDSLSDWSQRPLADSQLEYAVDDVVYLPMLYRKMTAELEAKGRIRWLDDEFKEMANPSRFEDDSRMRFRHLRRASQLTRRQLSAAREVAAWREEQAQRRNVPRKWVMTDEQIVEACRREARGVSELFAVRGMRDRLSTGNARHVANLIAKGLDASEDSWPALDHGGKSEPNVDLQIDLMNALVRLRARENDIAMPTLASHDDLAKLARGHLEGLELMRGWRKAIIGSELLDLLAGRISLRLDGGDLVVERRGEPPRDGVDQAQARKE